MNLFESGTYSAHWPSKATRTPVPFSHNTKRFGDDVQTVPYPLFTKARTIGDECALVLPINYDRHFGPAFNQLVQENGGSTDFPFLDKISKVIILMHENSITVTHILASSLSSSSAFLLWLFLLWILFLFSCMSYPSPFCAHHYYESSITS